MLMTNICRHDIYLRQGKMKAPVEVQFAQKLASNEPWVRDKAVKKLKKWFGAKQDDFEEVEMMKIWKGLYYCFWMSDKPLVQEELAENISSFVSCFRNTNSSLVFVKSFLKTFGREWFGLDRWRTDKFMMFTRRFLRYTFRFVASNTWQNDLIEKVVNIFREELILCPISNTSLGFQLHFTDVFLEEIAKAGGEDLSSDVLEMFLEPYIEVVRAGEDARFRDHVVERIFNHLIRQSDPGIQWQMEEDGLEESMEEGMSEEEEESDNEKANGTSSNGDVDESDNDVDDDAEIEDNEMIEDPRAGVGDAIIPQINVNYLKLSERLFDLGSADGIKKANRDALYKVSKMLKDVANDLFPLGPNLSDEDIDIPKISVKKSAAELLKRNEEMLKKNLEEKINNKKIMSEMSEKAAKLEANIDESEAEDHEEGTVSASEDDVHEDITASSSGLELREKKLTSKELKRKRKQEQKKRKREKALLMEKEKDEKMKHAQEMIEQDMDRKIAMEPKKVAGVLQEKEDKVEKTTEKLKLIAKKKKKKEKLHSTPEVTNDGDTVKELIKMAEDLKENSEAIAKKKKKKKKDTASVQEDGDNSVIKKNGCAQIAHEKDVLKKVENTSDQAVVCDKTPTDITLSEKKKKKKAKSEIVAETTTDSIQSPDSSEFFTPNTSVVADVSKSSESKKKKKKDKKLKRSASEAGLSSIDKVVDEKGSELKQEPLLKPPEDTPSKLPKKMKKKKKEMHRIDSDIAFNAPSLSKINLMLGKSQDTKAEETLADLPVPEPGKSEPSTPVLSAKKKKKMKKYNAETSLLNNEVSPVKPFVAPAFPSVEEKIETPKAEAEKKKKKVATLDSTVPEKSISGVAPKSTKVFEEDSSWDAPLQPGETEIVLPNKSYKGTLKMSEAATVPGEGVLNGIVTPAKPSHTATFLKKALSKSVDGKKIKKEKSKTLMAGDKCSSEPRKKKVNIVETRNKSQDIPSHLRSVKNSPQTPHDPNKNPAKGVLKKRVSLESGSRLNPVQLNTQLNGRSTVKKRKFAMDFF